MLNVYSSWVHLKKTKLNFFSMTSPLPKNMAIIFSQISINNSHWPVNSQINSQQKHSTVTPPNQIKKKERNTVKNYCNPLLSMFPFWLLQTRVQRSYLKVNFLLSDQLFCFLFVWFVLFLSSNLFIYPDKEAHKTKKWPCQKVLWQISDLRKSHDYVQCLL